MQRWIVTDFITMNFMICTPHQIFADDQNKKRWAGHVALCGYIYDFGGENMRKRYNL